MYTHKLHSGSTQAACAKTAYKSEVFFFPIRILTSFDFFVMVSVEIGPSLSDMTVMKLLSQDVVYQSYFLMHCVLLTPGSRSFTIWFWHCLWVPWYIFL